MVLYRDFPVGLDPAGTWAIEGFVSLDTVNILTQGNQNANIGIVDMGEYGNTGAVEMYTGMRNDGAPYSIGFESSINQFNVRRRSFAQLHSPSAPRTTLTAAAVTRVPKTGRK
jgi:hypothetical protein